MKFSLKKMTASLCAAMLAFTVFPFAVSAKASVPVNINKTIFPDESFRRLVKTFDVNGDDILSDDEIDLVTEIELYSNTENTKGIEYFTNLRIFYYNRSGGLPFDAEKLTSLDLSANTQLEELEMGFNSLSSLDLSSNKMLKSIMISCNRLTDNLTSLVLGEKPVLERLWCKQARLTEIDLSGVNKQSLKSLDLEGNLLTNINLAGFTGLGKDLYDGRKNGILDLHKNRLGAIELSDTDCSRLKFDGIINNINLDVQEIFVEKNDDNTIDLSQLTARCGFDVERAYDWSGGTVAGTTLTLDDGAKYVTYKYKCNRNSSEDIYSINCTLVPVSKTAFTPNFSLKWEKGKKTDIDIKWFNFYGTHDKAIFTPSEYYCKSSVKYEIKLYCNGTSESDVFDSFVCENEEWWKSIKDYLEKETAPKSGTLYFSIQAKEAVSYFNPSESKNPEHFYEFTGNESEVFFSDPLAYNTVNIKTVSSVNIINATLKYTEGDAPVFTAEVAPADKDKYEITCESIQDVDKNDPNQVNGAVYSDDENHGNVPTVEKMTSEGNYYAGITVKAKSGYKLADSVKITFNGITVKPEQYPTTNGVLFAARCTKISVISAAHVHDLTKVPAVEPTYTSDGNIEYFKCTTCGKLFKDGGAVTEITINDTVIPKLTGHVHDLTKVPAVDPTYTSDGNIEYFKCTTCGKLFKDSGAATEITLNDTVIPKLTGHIHIDADGNLICDSCNKITVAVIPGVVTANGTAPSVSDARMALRFAVGLENPTAIEKLACDTNFDKEINVSDARNILRVAVGLDSVDIWELSKHL